MVPKPEFKDTITKEELLESLRNQFHKTWIPDDVLFIDEVQESSVGKFFKAKLREDFKNYRLEV